MSAARALRAAGWLLLALLLGGCDEGTETRIREKADVFVQLTPAKQQNIINGIFEVGDTGDMVYMAIGAPAQVKSKAISDGTIEMWTYVNYRTAARASQLALTTGGGPAVNPAQKDPNEVTRYLAVPDAESNTLYVFFLNGRVIQIKLDTQGRK